MGCTPGCKQSFGSGFWRQGFEISRCCADSENWLETLARSIA
jgi:hypothetical protein